MSAAASILVVDDVADIRDGLKDCLEGEGYAVRTAEHGRAALNVLRSSRAPDLIVLDLMMPVMDGFAFLEVLRGTAEWTRIPVIVITAGEPRADTQLAEHRVFRVFTKPLRMDRLCHAIGLALAA